MVTTIAISVVAFAVTFCLAPVDKVRAILKWSKSLVGKSKEKIVSRSKEWKNAFSKKEEDSND